MINKIIVKGFLMQKGLIDMFFLFYHQYKYYQKIQILEFKLKKIWFKFFLRSQNSEIV